MTLVVCGRERGSGATPEPRHGIEERTGRARCPTARRGSPTYQLDGEYALSELLAPGTHIQLTNFTVGPPTFSDSAASAAQLPSAAQAAQGTPAGRARLALAMTFLNVSPWGGASIPNIYD